jgi:carbohydrate kinase (thermoresistant glucokinase family)
MGACGCGKSTIAQKLASRLGVRFLEGDQYHSPANKQKMADKIPLEDADRWDWLETINRKLIDCETDDSGAVVACSALKESYRVILRKSLRQPLKIVFLSVPRDELVKRVTRRTSHFMPPELVDSQLDTLEPPENAFIPDPSQLPSDQIDSIVKWIATSHKAKT